MLYEEKKALVDYERLVDGRTVELINVLHLDGLLNALLLDEDFQDFKIPSTEEFIRSASQYSDTECEFKHLNLMDSPFGLLLTVTIEEEEEYNVTSSYGVLGYVYNCTHPSLSELGVVYFEDQKDGIRRVG